MAVRFIPWDRKRISEPGAFAGVPIDAYHGQQICAGPSVSSSGLRTIFTKSPAHFFDTSSLNPHATESDEKEAFILGRAAHHLLLGEDDFSTLFICRPAKWDSWRTDAAKDWREEQESQGRTVLLPAQIEQIRGMARALAEHPLVRAGILNGEIERSLFWRDPKTNVWLKIRPDAIPNASGDFADLKTCAGTGTDLDRAVSTYRYDMQAALVKWGAREVLGLEMESFSFVFTEKRRPHCVDALTLDKAEIEEAELDLRVALDTFAYCLKTGDWFGPSGAQNDARYVRVSDWAKLSAQNRRAFLAREIHENTNMAAE